MKEASWNDCLFNNLARSATPDVIRAKSLKETAKERISLIKTIDEKNCNFVFEDYYTSINEVLQAISFSKGFNILNHVCLGFYLRDELKKDELFRIFDELRFKRNSLTYYGKRMDFKTARLAIDKSIKLFNELIKLLNF